MEINQKVINGSLTAGEIAAVFDVSPATVSKAISKAEFITGQALGTPDPEDKRRKLFTETEIKTLEPFILKGSKKETKSSAPVVDTPGALIPREDVAPVSVDVELVIDAAKADWETIDGNWFNRLNFLRQGYVAAAYREGARTRHEAAQAFHKGFMGND